MGNKPLAISPNLDNSEYLLLENEPTIKRITDIKKLNLSK